MRTYTCLLVLFLSAIQAADADQNADTVEKEPAAFRHAGRRSVFDSFSQVVHPRKSTR